MNNDIIRKNGKRNVSVNPPDFSHSESFVREEEQAIQDFCDLMKIPEIEKEWVEYRLPYKKNPHLVFQ